MSDVSIGWDETAPGDAAGAGFGALNFRSLKSAIRTGLAAEHDWPSSSGNAGAHKKGSARAFVGSLSQVSSADTDGRLMWETTTESLMYLSSTSTAYIGGKRAISTATTYPAVAAGQRLVTSFWSVTQATWPTGNISLPQTYVTPPFVVASIITTGLLGSSEKSCTFVKVGSVTINTCTLGVYDYSGAASTDTATVHLMATGIAAL